MSTLAEVLAAADALGCGCCAGSHWFDQDGCPMDADGFSYVEHTYDDGCRRNLSQDQVAATIAGEWLAGRLAAPDMAEAVADVIADVRDQYPRLADDADSEDVATAALGAVRVALGVTGDE